MPVFKLLPNFTTTFPFGFDASTSDIGGGGGIKLEKPDVDWVGLDVLPTKGVLGGGSAVSTLFGGNEDPVGSDGDGGKSNDGPPFVNVGAASVVWAELVVGASDFPFAVISRIPTALTPGAVLNLATGS